MYLSQLELNRLDRCVLRDIASPQEMHRTLWRAFPDEADGGPGRILYRLEPLDAESGEHPVVLVQSERQPDWSALAPGYLHSQRTTAVQYLAEPDSSSDAIVFRPGQQFGFRLVANPPRKREGKRHGLFREEDQWEWLQRKGEAAGFTVDDHSLLVVPLGTARSGRDRDSARRWFGVRYEGGLRVKEPSRFAAALAEGIGPAKAFGFGLLSVMRR